MIVCMHVCMCVVHSRGSSVRKNRSKHSSRKLYPRISTWISLFHFFLFFPTFGSKWCAMLWFASICFRFVDGGWGVTNTDSATCHGTVMDGRRESPGGGAKIAFWSSSVADCAIGGAYNPDGPYNETLTREFESILFVRAGGGDHDGMFIATKELDLSIGGGGGKESSSNFICSRRTCYRIERQVIWE